MSQDRLHLVVNVQSQHTISPVSEIETGLVSTSSFHQNNSSMPMSSRLAKVNISLCPHADETLVEWEKTYGFSEIESHQTVGRLKLGRWKTLVYLQSDSIGKRFRQVREVQSDFRLFGFGVKNFLSQDRMTEKRK